MSRKRTHGAWICCAGGCNNSAMPFQLSALTRTAAARVAGAVTVTVALVLGVWWFTRAPAVPALTVQSAPLLRTLQFSARVATASRVDVGATVTGRVLQVAVAEGAAVGLGDVLVQLESAELQAVLNQARASEQQAAARVAGLASSGRQGAEAGVAQADSVLRAAQADGRRTQDLVTQGFLSPSRLDEAQRAVAVAQAQLDGARAQRAANAGTDVAQAQAQLSLARAATQAALARLAQATLRAPAAARVLTRAVEPGQIVQPGRALLTLALAGPVQLVATVDERYLQQLQPGQPASVRADAYPEQRFAAQVLSIAPLVDAQRGAVEVKFSLAQAPAFLREDMTLSVAVETARRDAALAVPLSALRRDDDSGATLWLAREGRVEARNVRLGLRTLQSVEVVQGLQAGDVVLLGGASRPAPAPGARVRAEFNVPGPPRAAGEDAGTSITNAVGR